MELCEIDATALMEQRVTSGPCGGGAVSPLAISVGGCVQSRSITMRISVRHPDVSGMSPRVPAFSVKYGAAQRSIHSLLPERVRNERTPRDDADSRAATSPEVANPWLHERFRAWSKRETV
jgi:hypothetical protein